MKQNPTIYKVRKKFTFENVKEKVHERLILNNKKVSREDHDLPDGVTLHLIIDTFDEKTSDWSTFLPASILKGVELKYYMPSVLLIINKGKNTFIVVGGSFYKYIVSFIDNSYGLNTYARLMNQTVDEIINIKTRGVTGLRAGMEEQFKDDYKIIDYIKFGKIPVEIKVKLAESTVQNYFKNFINSRSPNIILNISTGFNIGKKINFSDLIKLIELLISIESIKPNEYFSSYKEISEGDKHFDKLQKGIVSELFNQKDRIINSAVKNFDLCYPNKVQEFYSSDKFELYWKEDKNNFKFLAELSEKSQVMIECLRQISDMKMDTSLVKFRNAVHRMYIYSYPKQSTKKSKANKNTLFWHLNGEIYLKGIGTYIFIDSKWYQLRDVFIREMNQKSSEILTRDSVKKKILNLPWGKLNNKRISEKEYNLQYCKQNYIVLDRVIIESIELADILYYNDDELYLCHVKYGFCTEMRDLYSQVINSARRLTHLLRDGENKVLKELHKKLIDDARTAISLDDFIGLFRERNINYVMGFTGHLKNGLNPKDDIQAYSSNIAKMSLIQCSAEMRSDYFDFTVEVIDQI